MKFAVCCPGPSLPRTWVGRDEYARVWAVNRAMRVVEDADWLAATDVGFFQGLLDHHRPMRGTLTSRDTAGFIVNDDSWGTVRTWEESEMIQAHQRRRPVQWTIQAALIHAAETGYKGMIIDLFGTGYNGDPIDCTGYPGENRGPARWERESADLDFTYRFLREHGVTVRRIIA